MQKRHMTALLFDGHRGTFSIHHRILLGSWLIFLSIAVLQASPAKAAETSAAAASALKVLAMPLTEANSPNPAATTAKGPSGQTSPGRSITVQKGESIDAVIRRGLPGLALRDDFMRQALARANPRIFPKGQTYPVKPGTVLTLPSHEDLRQHILLQYPATVALFQAPPEENVGKDQASGPDKRRWVRFP
jgi:Tfp pilus assembly protein FimV